MNPISDNKSEKIIELQFEYAWRWFSLHTNQRMSAFNLFLLASGVVANAYVLLIREGLDVPAASLAFIAVIVSIGFFLVDQRNHQLLRIGEDFLVYLEKEVLGTRKEADGSETTGPRGLLLRELIEGEPRFYLKHRFPIGGVETLVACAFLAGGIWVAVG